MITTNEQLLEALTYNEKAQPAVFETLGEMLRQTACFKSVKSLYDDICKQALVEFKPVYSNVDANKDNSRVGKPIKSYLDIHLADNKVFSKISKWHKTEMVKAEMVKVATVTEPSECPFKVAEECLEQSKYDFVQAFSKLTKVDPAILKNEKWGKKYLACITETAVEAAYEKGLELGFFFDSAQPQYR
ncbi:MAG: hypothetical protein MJK04_08330 [Psychrosphaera sp.]|nr:hypothetical protein [Psychrosphaera sp.]